MKTKIILSAILAATVALSGSVFAGNHPGGDRDGNRKPALLYKKLCGTPSRPNSKGMADMITGELPGKLKGVNTADFQVLGNRDNASAICKIIEKKLND